MPGPNIDFGLTPLISKGSDAMRSISAYQLFERAYAIMKLPNYQITRADVEEILGGKFIREPNVHQTVFAGTNGTDVEITLYQFLTPTPMIMGPGTQSPYVALNFSFKGYGSEGCLETDIVAKELHAEMDQPPQPDNFRRPYFAGDGLEVRFNSQGYDHHCLSDLSISRTIAVPKSH